MRLWVESSSQPVFYLQLVECRRMVLDGYVEVLVSRWGWFRSKMEPRLVRLVQPALVFVGATSLA
jgi:hypothetical protein